MSAPTLTPATVDREHLIGDYALEAVAEFAVVLREYGRPVPELAPGVFDYLAFGINLDEIREHLLLLHMELGSYFEQYAPPRWLLNELVRARVIPDPAAGAPTFPPDAA